MILEGVSLIYAGSYNDITLANSVEAAILSTGFSVIRVCYSNICELYYTPVAKVTSQVQPVNVPVQKPEPVKITTNEEYVFTGVKFDSKESLIAGFEKMMSCYNIGDVISNPNHKEFIIECLARTYNTIEFVDIGIREISKGTLISGEPAILLKLKNYKRVSVYIYSLLNNIKKTTHGENIYNAFRYAAHKGKRKPGLQIHHVGMTFHAILNKFIYDRNIDFYSVEINGFEIVDDALRNDWVLYHDCLATLEYVSVKEHEEIHKNTSVAN